MNESKYKVVWKVFFGADQVHAENLSKSDAEKLSETLNSNNDCYEYTVVQLI